MYVFISKILGVIMLVIFSSKVILKFKNCLIEIFAFLFD